jgi:hypothetical protein
VLSNRCGEAVISLAAGTLAIGVTGVIHAALGWSGRGGPLILILAVLMGP